MADLGGMLTALASTLAPRAKAYNTVPSGRGGWLSLVKESYAGAWQQTVEVSADRVMTHFAVWSCMTLIASDIAKLRCRLVQRDENLIWIEVESPAFSPVLRKPNHMQMPGQFWENWLLSKLATGNTYVLKLRDNRGVVRALYVLDPTRVTPLVSDIGDVFYQLQSDNIVGLTGAVTVPASEIIHDRWNCLYHPLVGMSPIYAAGLAATQGLNIQSDSTLFFGNRSMPGGILSAPGTIGNETAERLKTTWETNFGGENKGKIAVLGDGLKFEAMRVTADDSQVVEQLKWTAEVVCSTFHVPPYKIGIGQMPTYNNIQALNVEYYSQCLQRLIEDAEACMDDGLGLGVSGDTKVMGVEFDIDGLLRMDAMTQMDVLEKGRNYLTPNEGRRRINLGPKAGGDAVYRQQQDYSLEALAKRDAQADPFSSGSMTPAAAPAQPSAEQQQEQQRAALAVMRKGLQ